MLPKLQTQGNVTAGLKLSGADAVGSAPSWAAPSHAPVYSHLPSLFLSTLAFLLSHWGSEKAGNSLPAMTGASECAHGGLHPPGTPTSGYAVIQNATAPLPTALPRPDSLGAPSLVCVHVSLYLCMYICLWGPQTERQVPGINSGR